jgi:ABC-type lipoprotein release transport system permease subunit
MVWTEKQRHIIEFALASLSRRPGKNLAVLVVYTAIVFILSSILFFTNSLKKEASSVLQGAPEIVVQRIVAGRHDLMTEDYIRSLGRLPGVQEARGRLWGYYYEPLVGANLTLVVPPGERQGAGSIAVGQGVARSLKARKGDFLTLKAFDGSYINLGVSDVFSPESELVSADLIEISGQDFRRLFNVKKGYFTDITLRVANSKEVGTVAAKIRFLFPDTRPVTRGEILRTYDAIFDWRGGLLAIIFSGAVLAFTIFAWEKGASMGSEEKREIGVLKAIGWETSDILAMKSWEGAVISLSSFLLGVTFAYIHVFFGSYVLFEPVLKGWSVLYPVFHLIPHVDPYQLLALFFLTVAPYTVATIIPSWKAAIVDPDQVMRL